MCVLFRASNAWMCKVFVSIFNFIFLIVNRGARYYHTNVVVPYAIIYYLYNITRRRRDAGELGVMRRGKEVL